MFYFMKILITYYGVLGLSQLIKAEIKVDSYEIPREELQPLMDKLAKFSECNNKSTTGAINYEFIFTSDQASSFCNPHRLLQRDMFVDLLQNAINKTVDIYTSEQGETNQPMSIKIISNTNTTTSNLPAEEEQDIIGITTKAPNEMSTTLDPLKEKQMREKRKRNDYIATIITAVLVGLMLAAIVGCACVQYVQTARQSGTYVVNNP